jgi:hypothetical protein
MKHILFILILFCNCLHAQQSIMQKADTIYLTNSTSSDLVVFLNSANKNFIRSIQSFNKKASSFSIFNSPFSIQNKILIVSGSLSINTNTKFEGCTTSEMEGCSVLSYMHKYF